MNLELDPLAQPKYRLAKLGWFFSGLIGESTDGNNTERLAELTAQRFDDLREFLHETQQIRTFQEWLAKTGRVPWYPR